MFSFRAIFSWSSRLGMLLLLSHALRSEAINSYFAGWAQQQSEQPGWTNKRNRYTQREKTKQLNKYFNFAMSWLGNSHVLSFNWGKVVNDFEVGTFFFHKISRTVCCCSLPTDKRKRSEEWNRNQIILHSSHKLHSMIALLITSKPNNWAK